MTLTVGVARSSRSSPPGNEVRPVASRRLARWSLWLPVLAGVLVGWRRAQSPWGDADVLWGIRAGRDFLHSFTFARADPYSWTAHGSTWVPNSWGWNVLLAACYNVGRLPALACLTIALCGGMAVISCLQARQLGARVATGALIFQVVALTFSSFLYCRPQLADCLAVIVLGALLPWCFASSTRREFLTRGAAVLAVQIGWMNLHSSALVGPVLIGAFGAGHLLRRERRPATVVARTVSLTVLAAAGCLATPYGFAAVGNAAEVRAASVGLIAEWQPIGFGDALQWLDVVAVLLAAISAFLLARRRRYDAAAVLVVLAVLACTAVRFAPLAALSAIPGLAMGVQQLRIRPTFPRRILAATSLILLALCLLNVGSFGQPGSANYSPRLVAAVPSGCRMLNDYTIGDELILQRPDVRVSIDSRNDLYGRPREEQYLRMFARPAVGAAFIRRNHVDCLLAPTDTPLVQNLMRNPAWTSTAHDASRSLLVRS